VVISYGFRDRLKLSLPVMSLFRVMLQIIKHPLLAPVQAHARNVQSTPTKTTAKATPMTALHLNSDHG
jgi:hypothetical protein